MNIEKRMNNEADKNPEAQDYCYEDEIDLREVFRTLADQKKVIFSVTAACVFLSILYLVFVTPLYQVNIQIKSGLKGWPKEDIVSWLKEKQYINLFHRPDDKQLRMIRAFHYRDERKANVINLFLYWPDPDEGRTFLEEFVRRWMDYYINKFPDENIVLAKNGLNRQIADIKQQLKNLKEIGITQLENRITEKVKFIELKRNNIETIKSEIEKQKALLEYFEKTAENVMINTRALIKARDELIVDGKQNDISILFLLNSIQQNISYADQVKSRLVGLQSKILQEQTQMNALRNEIEEIQNAIAEMKLKMSVELEGKKAYLSKQIKDLQYQLAHIGPIKVTGPATSTLGPVKPKKSLILSLALICGMLLGIFVAFFRSMLHG